MQIQLLRKIQLIVYSPLFPLLTSKYSSHVNRKLQIYAPWILPDAGQLSPFRFFRVHRQQFIIAPDDGNIVVEKRGLRFRSFSFEEWLIIITTTVFIQQKIFNSNVKTVLQRYLTVLNK